MLHKILKIVSIIISILAAVWLVRIILAGDTAIADSNDLQSSLVTPFIYIAYIIFAIALVFVVVFVLKNLFSNANSLKSTLIGLGAFAAVIVISYVLASGQETPMQDGEVLSASGSRWVETGIYAFYILAILAIGAMVFSGVKKLAK
ncbi:hypothetical protein [Flavimarina sp. Hel_I_48]|uniref:hypothetical protein n=1 Tax=Flavimarina sp. Hel_I_48 TaxID=1392488 RepID=UPI0004DEE333|nr:hypothetical protein [Flavimarina sp. Hel_I_48]